MLSHIEKMEDIAHPVILFDGVCNLCNSSVQFIIKRDRKRIFRYASLQSEFGKKIIERFKLADKNIDSIILFENNSIKIKSTAVLQVLKRTGGIYSILYVFIIVPESIRNGIYDFIARNRYRWFGKRETCMIPTPELKKRFIDF